MRSVSMIAVLAAAALATACGKPDEQLPPEGDVCEAGQAVCEITQNLTGSQTWTKDHVYLLKTNVFVEAGTLTIEPGTVIQGQANSSLAISRNATLHAVGTVTEPIVFTSAVEAGSRRAGDWGGLVLLGKAPLNVTGNEDNIEGYAESELTRYGGTDAAHSCGALRYARIEFAGYRLGGNNELNGLTVGGCGTATEIDFVQVHRGLDDGVEMFGGTANLKHVVITLPDDDGLDWDQGWTGKVQFLVTQQNRLVGNFGIEADNSSSNNTATPLSKPVLWNVTLIGSDRTAGSAAQTQGGITFKAGTAGELNNAIIGYFNDFAVDVRDAATYEQANGGGLRIRNSIFWSAKVDYTATFPDAASDSFDESAWLFGNADHGNTRVDPKLGTAVYKAPASGSTSPVVPGYKPASDSPALTAVSPAPPSDGFFDASATFVGAVGATDWLAGWTAYPES